MATSPNPIRSQGNPSPAHSHSTAATFGNAGGSNLPPSTSGPGGLKPPTSANPQHISRSSSQNTNHSSRSRPSAPNARIVPTASDPPYVIQGPSGRIACVADIRGNISMFNQIASETGAQAIIHTGDFGFYERASFERISDRTLRHLVQYSTLINPTLRTKLLGSDPPRGPASAEKTNAASGLRQQVLQHPGPLLSEFSDLLIGKLKLDVPVFTVWGACEDVAILERFRTGEYQVNNLFVLDEATTKAIEVGGLRLRLFGLGGAVVLHKLFDNGEGAATIAGGQGTMWTTALQIGELVDTAQKTFDPTETRLLITHASPGREGLLAQLALALKADLTVSAGLHFRYGVSYNEFSVQHDAENYRNKLQHAKQSFGEIWDTVKTQVDAVIDDNQRILLNNALAVANRVPPTATATGAASEEPAWKNTWNWNLPDAAYGNLVLNIKDGRVSAETRSQGFNFAYRRSGQPMSAVTPTATAAVNVPALIAQIPSQAPISDAPAPVSVSVLPPVEQKAVPAAPPSRAASTRTAEGNGGPTPSKSGATTPSSAKPVREKKERSREKTHESSASRSDMDGGFTSGTDGRKSPSSMHPRKARNPFTLYVSQLKEALPVTEEEIRTYFGPAAAGIVGIKLLFDKPHRRTTSSGKEDSASEPQRRQRPFAYVEFKDQNAMNEGLKRQGEILKGNTKPALEQADSNKASQQALGPAGSEGTGTATAAPPSTTSHPKKEKSSSSFKKDRTQGSTEATDKEDENASENKKEATDKNNRKNPNTAKDNHNKNKKQKDAGGRGNNSNNGATKKEKPEKGDRSETNNKDNKGEKGDKSEKKEVAATPTASKETTAAPASAAPTSTGAAAGEKEASAAPTTTAPAA